MDPATWLGRRRDLTERPAKQTWREGRESGGIPIGITGPSTDPARLAELEDDVRELLPERLLSRAGNFVQEGSPSYAPIPVQTRIPEDVPFAVLGVAGVDSWGVIALLEADPEVSPWTLRQILMEMTGPRGSVQVL